MRLDGRYCGFLKGIFIVSWYILSCLQPVACFTLPRCNLPLLHHCHLDGSFTRRLYNGKGISSLIKDEQALHLSEEPKPLEKNEITICSSQTEYHVNEELIHDTCQLYRSVLGFDDFSVDVLFVDNDAMIVANREAFGKEHPTDIISHAANSKYIKKDYHLNRSPMHMPELRHLGGILLCPDYINRQIMGETDDMSITDETTDDTNEPRGVASRMKGVKDLNLRFCYLLAHGFLHLLGYDHVEEHEFAEMLLEEDKLLNEFLRYYETRTGR